MYYTSAKQQLVDDRTMFSKDVEIGSDVPKTVLLDLHSNYLINYVKDNTNWEKIMAEYLKMSGIYWSLTAMDLMNKLDKIGKCIWNEFG